METTKQTDVINDIILINNDRVVGYDKAINSLKPEDSDLKNIFQARKEESEKFHKELMTRIPPGTMEHGTTNSGKIYRGWMNVKAFFGGDDRKGILNSCEGGEDAALAAYKIALESDDLSPEIRSLFTEQQEVIRKAHELINSLRDNA